MCRMFALVLSALLVLTSISLALAAGPPSTATNTPPSSVSIGSPVVNPPIVNPPPVVNRPPPNRFLPSVPPPSVPIVFPVPPSPAPPPQGLGTPNDFATLATPGNTSGQPGVFNPFNNPHPMLPWGDGQIGGQRYGQVLRYWENQPQTVYNVRFEQAAAPPQELDGNPQPPGQPSTPTGALSAKVVPKEPDSQSVTVPEYWIVETTRGYFHMPRWVLQEIGGGYYRWALVTGWFQPR